VAAERIIMVASENDALAGGKVGGVGDVLRDLPRALARQGCTVTVIVPSYGSLHVKNRSVQVGGVDFPFGGSVQRAKLYRAEPKERGDGVEHLLVDHPDLLGDPIYYNDPPDQPFARDAAKYALFCSAVGSYLCSIGRPYVLHLHDWHTGFLPFLIRTHPTFAPLRSVPVAFTIHNVAIQGTRPMFGHASSLQTWFPELCRTKELLAPWQDPRYDEPCFTPMAAAISLAAKVNTVSPTYAQEILQPSDPAAGFYGGEGIEDVLQQVHARGKLFGILNGCEYPAGRTPLSLTASGLLDVIGEEMPALRQRAERARAQQPEAIIASVTRIVEQKIRLLFELASDGRTPLKHICRLLESRNAVALVLGSGNAAEEKQMVEAAASCERFIFIRGYSDTLAQALYGSGTLFLMPSSFEPCGISQMLAMRDGQPCLVHAVGGLKDTVHDGVDGFTFSGSTPAMKADGLVDAVGRALALHHADAARWTAIRQAAAAARYTWDESARLYREVMYR
jgi:starch synthase